MILQIIASGLLAMATLFLGLAIFDRFSSLRRASSARRHPQVGVKDEMSREFFRLINDDAPNMLQHLSNWRSRSTSEELSAIVDAYIASSGMKVRNQILSVFMELYEQGDDGKRLETALGHVLDKINVIESEPSDSAARLVGEIRANSRHQMNVWTLLRALLVASQAKALKMKRELGAVANRSESPNVSARGVEGEMAQLIANLNILSAELAIRLPAERIKSKDIRRTSLNSSLEFLDEWAQSSPAFTSVRLALLPEAAIARHLARKFWTVLDELPSRSGDRKWEPSWPNAPSTGVSSFGAEGRERSSWLALICISAASYIVAWWLMWGTDRFDLDRVTLNIVQIETSEGTGMGFLVRPGGWIITNQHVVSKLGVLTIRARRRGRPVEETQLVHARVVSQSGEGGNGAAVLKISSADFPAELPEGLSLDKDAKFVVGQKVHIPRNSSDPQRRDSQGIILKIEEGLAIVNVAIFVDTEGGPVCDKKGVVIGITAPNSIAPDRTPSYGVAVPASMAWQLLNHATDR